ncbi:putative glycine betaine ABC transporter substrate-binding and permease component [Streptomyces bingchenggensis BCW-1]|uniref:Putative glycine betaine ABC transporter substrate-binding and permease component n=1 Tax=Streptomyces bingchenggensis (strain BCW-1) TaxID=749414 RepID=D7BU72_STRBB|nr:MULTISPECIES: ABC transporter permease/substrate binding protein [Streptomyces]ADI11621.1 putative glycine betaine ABC transporter substrate-binding and permease component [Streptomyces bingchenggensis BCW-1]
MPRIELGSWIRSGINFLRDHFQWLFDFISKVVQGMYDGVHDVLAAPNPLLLAGILAVLAWWLRGLVPAVLAFAGFALIDSIEQWDEAMETLSLVLVAGAITIVLAVPLGIWASRNRAVSALLRPVLDFMQTMPAFVYLIPGIFFFGVGVVPGVIATIVFAMPPGVRMTELGIRQVDAELVEAADAFGTTPRRTLLRVQLPLALPTIMAGVNQAIMLALSMVVIAGMVGGGGLGSSVFEAISSVDVALGFEGGIAVVILAMYLDRMTGALNQRVSPLGRRALAKQAASAVGGLKVLQWRPATSVAMVGVIVLALVAGGLNVFGGDDDGQKVTADVGKGSTVKLGYINWDEGVASTYLWKEILEQRGFKPQLQTYDVGALFTGMAAGDIDMQTDAWLPATHASYWKQYKDQLEDLGTWYDKTSLEVAVPSYVKDVKSLDDLKGKAGTFKGKIIGIEPGAGEMKIMKDKVLPDYDLNGEYTLVKGSTAGMLSQLERSYAKKEPVAVTLWSPHWAYSKYKLTKLADPKGAFGKGDGIHTIGRKGFSQKQPQIAKWMKNFKLSEKQLTSLEAAIQDAGKGKQQEGVRAWLKKNPGLVDKLAPAGGAGTTTQGKQAGAAPRIGYFPWDEDIATTYLWKNVLEKRGYKPSIKQYDVGSMFTGMSAGQIDVEFDGWLPVAQKQYWDRYKKNLVDIGPWYDKTSLEIAVPSYVKDVKSLADLKGKADKFKGKIIGIEPGTGEMQLLKSTVLKEYDLDKEYEVTNNASPAMLAQLERSYAKKEPVAVVLWTPHWAYSKYQLTKLADPKKAFGANNEIRSLGHKSFPKKYSEFYGWLKNWHMTEQELASLEQAVQDAGKGNAEKGVQKWIDAHPGIVDKMAPVSS